MNFDKETLKEIAGQKEKEWREIQEKRIDLLEKTLEQKSNELKQEKDKFNQLKQDFKYNLKLLEDRDIELEKFEQTLSTIRKQLSEKNAEISDLKIKIDELRKVNDNHQNSVDELKKYYLNRLNQKNSEFDKYKTGKDLEINQERNEIEKLKRTLQLQIQDLQFDLDRQRDELKNEFDQIIKKREHEYRVQTDEFNTTILAKDLEIKILKNELKQSKEQNERVRTETDCTENNLKSAEKKLKEKEWELKDLNILKDAKIKDLEQRVEGFKQTLEDLNRKNEDKEKLLIDKIKLIENLNMNLDEHKNLNQSLRENLSKTQNELRISKQEIESFKEEIKELKLNLSKQIELSKTKELVKNDLNQNYLSELDLIKNELKSNLDRINKLEKEKLDLNLEWQKKFYNLENSKLKDQQDIDKSLIEQRDQAFAQVQSLQDQLKHKESVIKSFIQSDPLGSHISQIEDLNEQKFKLENEKLKQIIKQMRLDMEQIATNNQESSEKYFAEDLKSQVLDLKQKNRELQSKIDEYVLKQKIPDSNLTDNTILNSHIKSLNETINLLRKEKVDLTALSKKQQSKLIYLEKLMNEHSEKERLKQTQLETLKYEMNSQDRRMSTEINNLKQIISNLELELNTTSREADEYHKATIEKNSEISSLENKISELNLKLSASGTQINFGAQELFIEQLKEEIKRLSVLNQQLQIKARQLSHELLRHKHDKPKQKENVIDAESSSESESDLDSDQSDLIEIRKENDNLKMKLKTAAKFINNLIKEKEHLIEMSNQLRGELNKIKFDNENLAILRINRDNEFSIYEQSINNRPKTAFTNKLEQLEKKQYELTKKQLTLNNMQKTKSEPNLNKTQAYKESNYTSTTSDSIPDENTSFTSSVKSENLKEIWKLIDENQNDSILNQDLKPDIKKVNFNTKEQKTPRTVPNNNNKLKQKPKIRNYNNKN